VQRNSVWSPSFDAVDLCNRKKSCLAASVVNGSLPRWNGTLLLAVSVVVLHSTRSVIK
jgi:hypothetical protein